MKLTDDDIRINYLVESGFPLKQAREYIKENPKPIMYGEYAAILSERMKELGISFLDPALQKLNQALKKFKEEMWNK